MKAKKILTIFLFVLIGLAGVVVYAIYNQYDAIVKNPMTAFDQNSKSAQANLASDDIKKAPEYSEGQITFNQKNYEPNKNVINILLLGIDWDKTRSDMGWRSDMNILFTVDFAQNKMTLTSIPRDTKAKVYYLNMSTGKIKSSVTDKINAAYSYGGGPDKFGPQNAMRSIGNFLSINGKYNVPIDYFISIDLDGVPKFASSLGGIDVTLDVNFPGLGKKGDTISLDEENSRAYLENRKEVGGELVRVSHEQQYLMAVAKKIKAKGAVASAPKLYATFLKFMHTNLTLEQIVATAKVLDNVNIDNVTIQTIDGTFDYINNISYFVPDMKDVENKIISLMYTPVS